MGTWYFLMEDSLSLDKSKRSSTFLDIVLKYYKMRVSSEFKYYVRSASIAYQSNQINCYSFNLNQYQPMLFNPYLLKFISHLYYHIY